MLPTVNILSNLMSPLNASCRRAVHLKKRELYQVSGSTIAKES